MLVWVLVAVALLCIALAAWLAFSMLGSTKDNRAGLAGQLVGLSPNEVQAELDRIVEDGMFDISIASVVQVSSGGGPAELRIQNAEGNRFLMQVALTLDSTGQQIYQSGVLEPNFYIQSDTLDAQLEAGMYDATATFTALDPQTEEQVGEAAVKVLVQVQG